MCVTKLTVMKFGVLLTKRGFLVNLIFSFAFFTLYFVYSIYLLPLVITSNVNRFAVQGAFHFTIAITLVLAVFFINRISKLRLVYASSIATSTIAFLLLLSSNEIFRLTIIFVMGIFFSVGLLAFYTYFWSLTVPEERGRIAGLIGFVSLPFYFMITSIVAETLDFPWTVMLSIFLSLGTLVVALLRPEKAILTAKKEERGNYYEKRSVILYTIPWIIFCLNNVTLAKSISKNISQQVPSSFNLFLTALQVVGTVFGTFGGGVIADFFGRRLSLAFSLTLYGISSALAGLLTNGAILSFVYAANGLSWGILLVLYSFVIWGDLANKENCAKMYSIGLVIYYSSNGLGLLWQVPQIPLVVSALAGCLLIFLSNVPIVLAPELLSTDFRERIRLKSHMDTVKKIKNSNNQG
jgi:MFS family permease